MPDGCELKCRTVMEGDRHRLNASFMADPPVHVEEIETPNGRGLRIWYWAYLEDIDAS